MLCVEIAESLYVMGEAVKRNVGSQRLGRAWDGLE